MIATYYISIFPFAYRVGLTHRYCWLKIWPMSYFKYHTYLSITIEILMNRVVNAVILWNFDCGSLHRNLLTSSSFMFPASMTLNDDARSCGGARTFCNNNHCFFQLAHRYLSHFNVTSRILLGVETLNQYVSVLWTCGGGTSAIMIPSYFLLFSLPNCYKFVEFQITLIRKRFRLS